MESINIAKYGAYSPLRQAGDYYFISGQVGIDPNTKTAHNDVINQLEQLFINLKTVLESVDLGLDDIIKTTIYLTDMNDFSVVNDLYSAKFSDPKPARSTIGVYQLPRVAGKAELKIEIDAIAYNQKRGKS